MSRLATFEVVSDCLPRRLAKVIDCSGAVKDGIFRLGHEVVDPMAEFMKKELNFLVAEQAWLVRSRASEVTYQSRRWVLTSTVLLLKTLVGISTIITNGSFF